jgi:hypothetical protein
LTLFRSLALSCLMNAAIQLGRAMALGSVSGLM